MVCTTRRRSFISQSSSGSAHTDKRHRVQSQE
jgi:hypothetical protein